VSEPEPELTAAQLVEEIKKLRVSDLVLSTVTTLAQLAYAKLEDSSRDLDQARLAIDTIQVLLPTLEGHVPQELGRDLGTMLADLKLAYAGAAAERPVD
jgi:hypothetical protein